MTLVNSSNSAAQVIVLDHAILKLETILRLRSLDNLRNASCSNYHESAGDLFCLLRNKIMLQVLEAKFQCFSHL